MSFESASKHPYLKRRSSRAGWYYVRRVPAASRGAGRPSVIFEALKTEDRREAERVYAAKHADIESQFARWETEASKPVVEAVAQGLTALTTTTLRRIIAEHREATLLADLDWRTAELTKAREDECAFFEMAGKKYHADDYYLMLGGDETITLENLLAYDLHKMRSVKLSKLREAQRLGDLTSVTQTADVLSAFNEEDRRRILQAMLSAEIDVLARIVSGDEKLFETVKTEAEAVRADAKAIAVTATWENCIAAWESYHAMSHKPEDSRRQIRAFLERFARWVKKPPTEVTREDFIKWRDMRLTVDKVSLSTVTSRDRLLLGTMYRRAIRAAVLPRGFDIPTTDIDAPKLSSTAAQTVEPRGYNDAEAAIILTAAEQETDPLYRWVPLLMYYSGARVGEPVHLRPGDVRCHEDTGIWCWFPTQHDGERTQKTGFSNRPVPLHSAIQKDFLAFVAKKKKEKAKYLFFNDWNPRDQTVERVGIAREKPGKKAIERLREWIHKVAKKHDLKIGERYGLEPNHGWRYRFETLCERVQISDDVQRWFTAHEAKDNHGNYKKPDVHAMVKALERYPDHRMKPSASGG